jgi:hypothetical protein
MLIGTNQAAVIFEIGYVEGAEAVVIVHAMRAREKFLRDDDAPFCRRHPQARR